MITQAIIEKAFSALYRMRDCKPPKRGTRKRREQLADVAIVLKAVESDLEVAALERALARSQRTVAA